jgi:hypothetical protein
MKTYRRKIHAEMVLWLVGLYRLTKKSKDELYFTTLDIVGGSRHLRAGGTNGTLLIHWGLIKKIHNANRSGAPAGSYRITEKGIDFLQGKIPVCTWVELRNGELINSSSEVADVKKCLGSKFNYNELMNGL